MPTYLSSSNVGDFMVRANYNWTMKNIGSRIREARKSNKITQDAIAKALRISRVSVTQWENGITTPATERLPELADLLGVTSDWLLNGGELPDIGTTTQTKPNASFPPRYQAFPQDHSIPLLGQSAGGPNGRFILNGTE